MRFVYIFSLTIFLQIYHAFSDDTLEVKTKEVRVEATKNVTRILTSFFPSNVMELQTISTFGTNKVVDALSRMPGVHIRDYGGLGGVKTISVRGFSAPNTSIFIEGTKINTAQNGMFDLSLIGVNQFESIELIRGGSSPFFGGNSTAGVINLTLNSEPKNSYNLLFSYSSFNTFNFSAKANFLANQNTSNLIGINITYSDGDYPFRSTQFGENKILNRKNAYFKSFSGIYKFHLTNNLHSFDILTIVSKVNRGVPGAVLQNIVEQKNTKLDDQFLLFSVSTGSYFNELQINNNINVKFLESYFFDPEGFGIIIKKSNILFINREINLRTDIRNINSGIFTIYLAPEVTFTDLRGNMLQNEVGDYVKRLNISMSALAQTEFQVSKFVLNSLFSYRFDWFNNIESQNSIAIGTDLKFKKHRSGLRLTLSNNFRPPSFNELYYLNYGTANLKSEYSLNLNAEIYSTLIKIFDIKISSFAYKTKNKIVSFPKTPIQWIAKNLGVSETFGIEANCSLNHTIFDGNFSFTYQKVIDKTKGTSSYNKQLPYTPHFLSNLNFTIKCANHIYFNSKINYVGKRYYLSDESRSSELNSYTIFNFKLSYLVNIFENKAGISFEIENAFNEEYEIFKSYPMPRRSIKFEIFFGN